jgi:ABC-type sugar transport system substrate-binding protein
MHTTTSCIRVLLIMALSQLPGMAAPRIGLLLKDRDLFFAAVQKGAEDEGKALNVELVIKAPSKANAPGQQLTLLAVLEKEPLAALVISPLAADDFKEPIARFVAKGVKIVVLDSPLPEGLANTFVRYDQKSLGEAVARFAAGLAKDGDEVAMLRANTIETISEREKAIISTLKEIYPNLKLDLDVMSGAQKGDDYDQSALLLSRHPNVKVVITPISAGTLGMMKAIKEKKLVGKVQHVGFGVGLPDEVVEAIETGAMQGWIAQEPRMFGIKGIDAAMDLINGKKVPPVIDIEYQIVTKANLKDAKVQALKN